MSKTVRYVCFFLSMFSFAVSTSFAQDAAHFDEIVVNNKCPKPLVKYNSTSWEKHCGKRYAEVTLEMSACRVEANEINAAISRYNKHMDECSRRESAAAAPKLPTHKAPQGSVSTFGEGVTKLPPNKPTNFPTSFVCASANSPAEMLICADEGLAKQDQQMARMYKKALENYSGDVAAEIKSDQRNWWKQRNSCETYNCVNRYHNQAINRLQAYQDAPQESYEELEAKVRANQERVRKSLPPPAEPVIGEATQPSCSTKMISATQSYDQCVNTCSSNSCSQTACRGECFDAAIQYNQSPCHPSSCN
ncbi:MAG: hypothetical protein E5Y04_26885 [Mesorhizobium sp.]|nr:MAG: hypothetical protein E5Y04_26885 [Mesorhizobium sp.]